METSTFTLTISHSDSCNVSVLTDSIRGALDTHLRNVDSVEVSRSVIEYQEPTMYLYMVTLENLGSVLKMPISCRVEDADFGQIRDFMTSKSILPSGYVVSEVSELSREAYDSAQNNLDPRDPRYEDMFERSSTVKYYRLTGSSIIRSSTQSIMSTKILFDAEGFKNYAVRLGKVDSVSDIDSVEEITKDEYFCVKYGADGKSEEWQKYSIAYTNDEGEEITREFKTKFLFGAESLVFAQAVRKGKIDSEAIMLSVTQIREESED